MAWNVIFVGMGLMMVSVDDAAPEMCGVLSVVGGLLYLLCSFLGHVNRLRKINCREQPSWLMSAGSTGAVSFLLIGAVSIELAYGLLYPYLLRSKIVEVSSGSSP